MPVYLFGKMESKGSGDGGNHPGAWPANEELTWQLCHVMKQPRNAPKKNGQRVGQELKPVESDCEQPHTAWSATRSWQAHSASIAQMNASPRRVGHPSTTTSNAPKMDAMGQCSHEGYAPPITPRPVGTTPPATTPRPARYADSSTPPPTSGPPHAPKPAPHQQGGGLTHLRSPPPPCSTWAMLGNARTAIRHSSAVGSTAGNPAGAQQLRGERKRNGPPCARRSSSRMARQ